MQCKTGDVVLWRESRKPGRRAKAQRRRMHVKFWGVRGSTPTPQLENMRYGGNTSCVEVRVNGSVYVFDCGTGFRNLGKSLSTEYSGKPIHAHIFISHFHWDHIQGMPFFRPLYDSPNGQFIFHSSSRAHNLEQVFAEQMASPYFPVNLDQMKAKRDFYDIKNGCLPMGEGIHIKTAWLNHPQGCMGFRLETKEGVLVYATDNEPGDPQFDKSVRKLAEESQAAAEQKATASNSSASLPVDKQN